MSTLSELPKLVVSSSDRKRYEVTLDRTSQVLRLSIPEDVSFEEGEVSHAEIYPSLSVLRAPTFVSASLLAIKAKQFDDGLYAAAELLAEAGTGEFPSRRALWQGVLSAVLEESGGGSVNAAALLAAAIGFVGDTAELPDAVSREAAMLRSDFLSDAWRSLPLGFYNWSEELAGIFQRDRLLQTKLETPAAFALASAIAGRQAAVDAYEAVLHLSESITNPLALSDLRSSVRAVLENRDPEVPDGVALHPPSRAHEAELIKSLFGDGPIPEDFELAEEMAARILDGRLSLEPTDQSGWYDYQTWALEPLVAPDRTREADRLRLSESYRRELESLFKALLALTRETHVKQLEIPIAGAAGPGREISVTIRPELTIEPTATYYLRRASSYAFVREVLLGSFGAEALSTAFRLTPSGPINKPLLNELLMMEQLFIGASEQSGRQIGLSQNQNVSATQAAQGLTVYDAWCGALEDDPDLGVDVRMMVPLFYDVEREKMKVWAVFGYATKPLTVSFDNPPVVVEVRDSAGRLVSLDDLIVEFEGERRDLVYLVSAEAYVSEPMTRVQFREHCDRYRTFEAILENLR